MTTTTIPKRRLALALALAVVSQPWAGAPVLGDEKPRTSSAVKATAQGGAGTEPVSGAPPAVEPSLASRPARAAGAARTEAQATSGASMLRAVSLGDGEATLELGGKPLVVRPGSRLAGDSVRSVTPERIVLERPPQPGEKGGPGLVIVTFDAEGRATTRVFWTHDPARGAEVMPK